MIYQCLQKTALGKGGGKRGRKGRPFIIRRRSDYYFLHSLLADTRAVYVGVKTPFALIADRRKQTSAREKVMEDREYDLEKWNSLLFLGQDLLDRQGAEIGSPMVAALAGGLAFLAIQLLLALLAPLLSSGSGLSPLLPPLSLPGLTPVAVTVNREERPRLQNHPRCGITTGGQVRVVTHIYLYEQQHNSRMNVGGIVRLLPTQHWVDMAMVKPSQTLNVCTIVSPTEMPQDALSP